MSKLLTTGEMIDTLQVGDIAECVNDHVYEGCKIIRKPTGLQFERAPFVISEKTFNAKWHILSHYVSFEEAMQALKEDKTVIYHISNSNFIEVNNYTNIGIFKVTFKEMILGNWTIEDEPNDK